MIRPPQDLASASRLRLQWLGLGLGVFLSRLPFIDAGYGADADAWKVADAARFIGTHGDYVAGRLPGNPLQELACSLLWRGGPAALNAASAAFAALAAVLFAQCLRLLHGRDFLLGGLALAFTPAVFMLSTCSMDYVWSTALLLASLRSALLAQPLRAGLGLGLAIGCRLPSAPMLLPIGLVLAPAGPAALLCFASTAALVGAAAFVPVFLRYGSGFLTYFWNPYYWPSPSIIFYKATVDLWGPLGLLALGAALFLRLLRGAPSPEDRALHTPLRLRLASGLVLVFCAFIYLKFPSKSAYLLPAVPFTLLLLGGVLHRRHFRLVCAGLIVSPLLCGVSQILEKDSPVHSSAHVKLGLGGRQLVFDFLQGPIFADHSRRLQRMEFTRRVIQAARQLPARSVLICGDWLLPIELQLRPAQDGPLRYEIADGPALYLYTVDEARLQRLLAAGHRVHALPRQHEFNFSVHGFDLGLYPVQGFSP